MRYRAKGVTIVSENAAKPVSRAAACVVEWIEDQTPTRRALDYGCGKLRYAVHLAGRCKSLTLVDSETQVGRTQTIAGVRTTVRDFAASRWDHARVLTPEEFVVDSALYDLGLCANVLSAIPSRKARSRMLKAIRGSLSKDGVCLFVTQYRNSYFEKATQSPNAVEHLDGWIVRDGNVGSYYGILPREKLQRILRGHAFTIRESWVSGQSACVVAARAGCG